MPTSASSQPLGTFGKDLTHFIAAFQKAQADPAAGLTPEALAAFMGALGEGSVPALNAFAQLCDSARVFM